jgi:hypothetical protein
VDLPFKLENMLKVEMASSGAEMVPAEAKT